MPIKHLDQYLSEHKQYHELSLNVLSDSRLGIDASHYLRLLLESPETREPLLAATGGLPLSLTAKIESDLRTLEKLRIKPVFVFPGLLPNKKQKPNPHGHADSCKDRKDAWDCYEHGQTDQATKLFETRSNIVQWDLWRSVLRIFKQRNVDFIVAPYVAWAQLIYLQRHQKSYINAVFAASDALLYPALDKLITSLDLNSPNPSFTYVNKRSLLNETALSEEQFLDVGILSGFDHSQTFPPIIHEQSLRPVIEMVKYYRSGYSAVSAQSEHPGVRQTQYVDQFARTRSMVKFSLIMSNDGVVQPLPLAMSPQPQGHPGHHNTTAADIPQNLEDIFTHRLPDEVYFYLSRGLVSPQPLIWLTSGQVVENPPLDNGETTEFKRFVREVITEGATGPRATALALISSVLHQFWSTKRVQAYFWFETQQYGNGKGIVHNGQATQQLVERVSGWNVLNAIIEEELRRQNGDSAQSSTIDFALCLGATATEKLAHRTRTKPHANIVLEKKDEVVANVIWRFLELRGFLIHSHTHSSLARAMHAALQQCKVNDKFQDSLYLFLELVRAGVLHNNLWSGRAYSGGPSFGTDEEKRCMLLIMRVLSIVPLAFKPQPWSGPLSRELLVFNSFLRSLSRALRSLVELTAMNMLLQRHARRSRDDLLDISLSLPFQADVNTGFGILAKVYLDALVAIYGGKIDGSDPEGVADAKEAALEICDETFEGIKNPRAEVERGFRFWDAALIAIRSLASEPGWVHGDLAEQFEAAEAWLRPMRP
ncbi:XPG I-region protein [Cantharellus anzutake]|uniref:XPG I-region protein n=1 Tax=Cantharellus anzutake TaxID=1750568 RepID=UPI001908237C|nr:XPG I-region protein [Cantharellus anzutake]KAF8331669.1 XPG I-region protein [Cantharellus anzutake]